MRIKNLYLLLAIAITLDIEIKQIDVNLAYSLSASSLN